jgi:hypothetical protein
MPMVRTELYTSGNLGHEKKPAILGMPGFVKGLEGGRIDMIFEDLSKEMVCMGMMYDGIEDSGSKVVCDFSLSRYMQNMKEAFEELSQHPNVDASRVGVIASSVSGAIFAYGLSNGATNGISPKCYVSVSPLVGWKYFGTEELRNALVNARDKKLIEEFPITSVYDAQRGITRVIPIRCLDEIEKIDGLQELANFKPNGMSVMTLVGALDDRASAKSMGVYHEMLGGKSEHLLHYESEGHAIPIDKMKEPVEKFFRKHLSASF